MEAVAGLTDRDLPAPPPALKENVMAAVRANPPEKKKGRILSFPLRSIAAAAALALVLWAGARVIVPKGSAGSAGVQMSMAAGSADAAKAEDATVDNAGVGDVYGDVFAVPAVQFFGKEHHGHLAVGIGSQLAVAAGVGGEELVVDMCNVAGEGDGEDDVRPRIHERQEAACEQVGAQVVGGGD